MNPTDSLHTSSDRGGGPGVVYVPNEGDDIFPAPVAAAATTRNSKQNGYEPSLIGNEPCSSGNEPCKSKKEPRRRVAMSQMIGKETFDHNKIGNEPCGIESRRIGNEPDRSGN